MRISDWSSDVCSSDLRRSRPAPRLARCRAGRGGQCRWRSAHQQRRQPPRPPGCADRRGGDHRPPYPHIAGRRPPGPRGLRRMTEAPLVAGLATLASRYDAFLLDQFGVLHDGSTVYPGVVACLEALQAAGRRPTTLSNSGTLRAASLERLARLGIPPALSEDFVTSGAVARSFQIGTASCRETGVQYG